MFSLFLFSSLFFIFTHHVQSKSGRPGELQGKEVSGNYCLVVRVCYIRSRYLNVLFSFFFSFFIACRKKLRNVRNASVHSLQAALSSSLRVFFDEQPSICLFIYLVYFIDKRKLKRRIFAVETTRTANV